MDPAAWTIFIIAILIALVIAWKEFDVKDDLERIRRRLRRRGPPE
jgi:hypothetical protein